MDSNGGRAPLWLEIVTTLGILAVLLAYIGLIGAWWDSLWSLAVTLPTAVVLWALITTFALNRGWLNE